MKKLFIASLACLALTGCSSPTDPATPDSPGTSVPNSGQPDSDGGQPDTSGQPDDGSGEVTNGGDPPEEVTSFVEPMREAMLNLSSVHAVTTVVEGKESSVMELTLNNKNECVGTVSGAAAGGGKLELRVVDNVGYIRGDERFWALEAHSNEEGVRISEVLNKRWVRVKPEELGSLTASCSLAAVLAPLQQEPFSTQGLEVGLVAELDHKPIMPAIVFTGVEEPVTVAISMADPHYLLTLDRGDLGRIEFSNFDETFTVTAPNNVVPLSLIQK